MHERDVKIFDWAVSIVNGMVQSGTHNGRLLRHNEIESLLTSTVSAVKNVVDYYEEGTLEEIKDEDEFDINENNIVWPRE